MAADKRGKQIIAEALARAMYDLPRFYLTTLRKGYDHSTAMEIARRMVRELDHAGWRVKSGDRRDVMKLEDAIAFGMSISNCIKLASDDPSVSKPARDRTSKCICDGLGMNQIVLVRKSG